MKKIFLFILYFVCSVGYSANVQINLSDVVERVSEENFNVYENALKVYQAKSNIEKARADLLPKLNLWKIAGMVLDPLSILDSITDVAPFLVPGNWFRVTEIKMLYLAEKEGYRALWGNEVYTAKAMYMHILLDQKLLQHVKFSITDLERVHRIIQTRETFGGAPPGSAREVEIRLLGLKEDEQNLENLLSQEYTELSYLLGYNSNDRIILNSVSMPVFEDLRPIDHKEYEFRLISSSPERRQFDHFLSVLAQIKNEIKYSFLGVSQISRGVAGGTFDSLPIPDGLGFGQSAAMNIVDAQREIVLTQKRGIEETLKRQLYNTTNIYNSDINNYGNFKRRVQLSTQSKNSILQRIELGENVNVLELSESSRNQIQAESALVAVQYRFLTSMDRLERLIFSGDYEKTAPLIESLKGSQP